LVSPEFSFAITSSKLSSSFGEIISDFGDGEFGVSVGRDFRLLSIVTKPFLSNSKMEYKEVLKFQYKLKESKVLCLVLFLENF